MKRALIIPFYVLCLTLASAGPQILNLGSDSTLSALENKSLYEVTVTNIESSDTFEIESSDPVCLFRETKIISTVEDGGYVVPSELGIAPCDTLTFWSENKFILSSSTPDNTGWLVKFGLKDYYVTGLFFVLFCFLAYLKFYQPQSFGFYFNPFALLNNRLYEASFNFQPFLFPNLIFLIINGAIIGAVVGDVCYPGDLTTKLTFSLLGAVLLTCRSILSYLVLSYLSAFSVNRVLHFNFVRLLNLYTCLLLLFRVEQMDFLIFGPLGLAILTFFFLALWLIRASVDILTYSGFQKFYFFSYLCALEMLPVLFVCLVLSRT